LPKVEKETFPVFSTQLTLEVNRRAVIPILELQTNLALEVDLERVPAVLTELLGRTAALWAMS
jgi:hypothetical protein